MTYSLAILLPTLPEPKRESMLCTLLRHINSQIGDRAVFVFVDPRGRNMTIGQKRMEMLQSVNTDYVVFIDDDDWVTHNYVELVYNAIQSNPDVVGMRGLITIDNGRPENWIISTKYKEWASDVDGYKYVRYPNHLSPIKREHALRAGFEAIRHAEDHKYSMRLKELGVLETQAFINEEIYTYKYITRK